MKNKRILSLVLAFAMLLGTFSFAFADEPVELNEKIAKLQELGLVEGDAGTGDLRLNDKITRAEVAVIVTKAYELQDAAEGVKAIKGQFKDVKTTHWANGFINVLAGKGILNGYPDGTFRPEKEITYSEFVTIMVMMLDEGKAPAGKYPFNMINRAAELGIINDVEVANFEDDAIREKVFEIFFNTITQKDANLIIANTVEGIVVENYRTERLAADEIVVHVMKDQVQREGKYYEKDDEFNVKLTSELKKKGLDVETLLGKVVTVSFDKSGKVVDIKVNEAYTYEQGIVDQIREKEIRVNGKWYTIGKDEGRDTVVDERLYQVYLNNEDLHYHEAKDFDKDNKVIEKPRSFAGKALVNDAPEFARITVRNGKVLFIDAFEFKDIAPVAKDVEGKVLEYYDDVDNGEISKLTKLDAAYVVVYEKGEMKLGNYEDIKANDVAHWYTDARGNLTVFVRPFDDNKVEGKYVDASAKRAKDEGLIYIKVAEDEYPALIKSENRNPVYSTLTSEQLFETLTEDYDEQLEGFAKQEVTLLLDMFEYVQLVGSDTLDGSFYALVTNTARNAGEIKLLRTDKEEEWYGTTRDTVFDGLIKKGTKDKEFDQFNRADLVKVNSTEDKEITKITRLTKDGQDVHKLDKNVIDFSNDAKDFFYLSKNVVVFVEGDLAVMDINTFLKNYYVPGDKDYEPYELDEDGKQVIKDGKPVRNHLISAYTENLDKKEEVAKIIVVKEAVSRSAGTTDLRARVERVRFTGGSYYLTLLYGDNKTVETHKVSSDVDKVTGSELRAKGKLIKAGDIIEVDLTKDEAKNITRIEKVELESARKVGKFDWSRARGEYFVQFADKDEPELVWISKDADQFGKIEVGQWVQYTKEDKYNVVDLIAAVGEPKEEKEELPKGSVEYKGIVKLDGNEYIVLGDKTYPLSKDIELPENLTEGDIIKATFVNIRGEDVVAKVELVKRVPLTVAPADGKKAETIESFNDGDKVLFLVYGLNKESTTIQKPSTLEEVKAFIDTEYGVNFKSENIVITGGKVEIKGELLSTEDWRKVKENGNRNIPYKITVLKNDKSNKPFKIAMYEDGVAVIE